MSLSSRQAVFARNVARLIEHIFSHDGHAITFGEAWRPADVAEIYEKQGRGIRNSLHCKRLAIDLNLFLDGEYLTSSEAHRVFGDFWESLHPANKWGGRWGDGNHFSMTDGITAG